MARYKRTHHEPKRTNHATTDAIVSELNEYFNGQPFFDGKNGSDEDANLVMRILAMDIVTELDNDPAKYVAALAIYCAMVLMGNRYCLKKPIHESFNIDEGYLVLGLQTYRKKI